MNNSEGGVTTDNRTMRWDTLGVITFVFPEKHYTIQALHSWKWLIIYLLANGK